MFKGQIARIALLCLLNGHLSIITGIDWHLLIDEYIQSADEFHARRRTEARGAPRDVTGNLIFSKKFFFFFFEIFTFFS